MKIHLAPPSLPKSQSVLGDGWSSCSRTQRFGSAALIWFVSSGMLQSSAGWSSRKYKPQPETEDNWKESPAVAQCEVRGAHTTCRDGGSESSTFFFEEKGRLCKDSSPGSKHYSFLFWHQGEWCFPQISGAIRWEGAGPTTPPVKASFSLEPLWEHTRWMPGWCWVGAVWAAWRTDCLCLWNLSDPSSLSTCTHFVSLTACRFGLESQLY